MKRILPFLVVFGVQVLTELSFDACGIQWPHTAVRTVGIMGGMLAYFLYWEFSHV